MPRAEFITPAAWSPLSQMKTLEPGMVEEIVEITEPMLVWSWEEWGGRRPKPVGGLECQAYS
jgi:hypothetical protein